jgi:obg-like ATPase 1
MPPKKNEAAANVGRKPIIGRLGTNLKMGIVGLPNVGKSTFFNILTKLQAAAENFPFCTIDPNEGRVPVPDARFDYLCEKYKPASKVPAFLNVVDIAGLVKGANEGKGLGNAFLSHIRACDGIYHMLRVFDDEEIIHVEGAVDPMRDIEIINEELRLKDLEFVEKIHDEIEKKVVRSGDKTLKFDYEVLHKILAILRDEKKWVRYHDWNDKEIEILNKHLLITSKPVVYLCNMSESEFIKRKNKWLPKIKTWIDENDPGATLIPFSAAYELKLQELATDEERKAYVTETTAASVMDKIIVTGYKALHLCYFFTAGEDEVKCWTIQVGTKAPQAAGRIHTDFEKGFIMAEVMKFDDFKEQGSEAAVKAAGKYRQQGKAYVVEDGDIILFKFNAGAGLGGGKK